MYIFYIYIYIFIYIYVYIYIYIYIPRGHKLTLNFPSIIYHPFFKKCAREI